MKNSKHVILVSEDEPIVRGFVCKALERFGFIAIEASEGSKAFELYRVNANIVDLVLTDVNCDLGGGIDGPKLIDAINIMNNALGRDPVAVIFMSGFVGSYRVQALEDVSKNPLIQKPVMLSFLIESIHTALAKRFTAIQTAV